MKTREEMMEYIQEALAKASDLKLEEFYWFLICDAEFRQHPTGTDN